MPNIIIRGSRKDSDRWQDRKDYLHNRRKQLGEQIKDGIMSKNEMNRGEEGDPDFQKKVEQYDNWKKEKEPLMKDWHDINREFKKHGEEGRKHSIDNLRPDGEKLRFE